MIRSLQVTSRKHRYISLLPPAYVVRREGNSFTLFVSSHLGGSGQRSIQLGEGGVRSIQPGGSGQRPIQPGGRSGLAGQLGGGGQVQPAGGGQVQPVGGEVRSSWGGQVKGQSSWGGQVKSQSSWGSQVKGQSSRGGLRSKVHPAGGGGQVQQASWGRSGPASAGGVRSSQRGQQGQHLAPSCGRYVSCVHAGGLSC